MKKCDKTEKGDGKWKKGDVNDKTGKWKKR